MADLRSPFSPSATDRRRLLVAVVLSLLFHLLSFATAHALQQPARKAEGAPPPLQATLAVPPLPLPAPVLIAPDAPTPAAARATPKARPAVPRPRGEPVSAVTTIAARQIAAHLLYPPQAVAQGLEGEALVMLFLDEAGDAVAARLERSSGHALLDEAAVHAARAVRALPEAAPREVLLPVRFRLR